MNEQHVLITGGTGKTGRRVAARLTERLVPYLAVGRSTHPSFDWYEPETWAPAVAGARAVYVVPLFAPDSGEQVARFVALARTAGVERVVLLSGAKPKIESLPHYSRVELVAEDAVKSSGMGWTIIRSSWMSENFSEDFFADGVLTGEIVAPAGAGRAPFVSVDDVADMAVAALTDERHDGMVYDITGPEALSFADAAATITAVTGSTTHYIAVDAAAYGDGLREMGLPDSIVEHFLALFSATSVGGYDGTTSTITDVLGRPATSFEDYVRTAHASGAWSTAVVAP